MQYAILPYVDFRQSHRAPVRVRRTQTVIAVTVLLIAVVTTAAGCSGSSTPSANQPYPNVEVDPTLRELLPADTRADGILTIATDPSYPPMEFLVESEPNGASELVGADIDLGRAIATKFGLQPKFEVAAFSNVVPAVAIRQYELGMSSLWADNPQAALVNMITYLDAGTQIAIRATKTRPDQQNPSFCGHSIAVEEGAEYIDVLVKQSTKCVGRGEEPITILTENSQARASKLLEDGKADALVGDSPTVQWTINRSNGAIVALGDPIDIRPYGIAVSTRYPDLTRATNIAMQQLIDSGTYLEILSRWQIANGAITESLVLFGGAQALD
ncbi:MAG: transporter substrate-binding domain-containing protein [Candidatus Nanopelagicales bacterium]